MLVKRESKYGGNGLINVYRPCTVDEIFGNSSVKTLLNNSLDTGKLRHTLLFSGSAGCGKTTAARIVALGLNCKNQDGPTSKPCLKCESCVATLGGYNPDVKEINVGQEGGKADVDSVIRTLAWAPVNSRYKVVIFDEAHGLTPAAKKLLLKDMEDGYKHVYLIFCTNEPEALRGKEDKTKKGVPFLGRCAHLVFNPLSDAEIKDILINVLEFEGEEYNEEVLNYVIEESAGVPRDALSYLENVIIEGSWELEAAQSLINGVPVEETADFKGLCKALLDGVWSDACKYYKKLSRTSSQEGLRILICGYFVGCLKRTRKLVAGRRFSSAVDVLSVPIYVSGKTADHIFYNMMFKVIDIMLKSKVGGRD